MQVLGLPKEQMLKNKGNILNPLLLGGLENPDVIRYSPFFNRQNVSFLACGIMDIYFLYFMELCQIHMYLHESLLSKLSSAVDLMLNGYFPAASKSQLPSEAIMALCRNQDLLVFFIRQSEVSIS
ncbi:hypothetical protein ACS0TY_022504 [Phlomoides rotata]